MVKKINTRRLHREKIYTCGDYLEVNIYPVFQKQRCRGKKAKPTSEVQKLLNQHNAEKKLIRLLNANFTADDIKCELTYHPDNHPENDKQSALDLKNFIRRLKRFRNKLGLPELKYVTATEKGNKKGRYHHHIIISGGLSPKQIAEIWGKGYVQKIQPLQFDECGIAGIAKYMPKAPIFFKRWNASRNLIQPEPIERDGRLSAKVVKELLSETDNRIPFEKLYPNYIFAQCTAYYNEINSGFYLCIRMYHKDAVLYNYKSRNTQVLKN